MTLGGYDESFEPAGYEDKDLLLRAQLMQLFYYNLPDNVYCRAIPNSYKETIVNTSSNLSLKEMDNHNYRLSLNNITTGKLKANADKDYIGIIDNIYSLSI